MNNLVSNLTRRDPIPPESPDMHNKAGPDVLASFDGVTMRVDLTPGPYSQSEAKRLLQSCDMLRELIEERTDAEYAKAQNRARPKSPVSFVEPEAES